MKSKIDQRLRDQYNQYYTSYRKENVDKSTIVDICVDDYIYLRQGYLNRVKSPYVRSILTRLRIDANKLNECRFRHYRKKSETSSCTHCGTPETVRHRLLNCNKGNLVGMRKTFLEQVKNCVPSRLLMDSDGVLNLILNVNPKCKHKHLDDMVSLICTFIKKVYEVE